MLADRQRHLEPQFLDPLIGQRHVVEIRDLDVECWTRVRIGLIGSRFTAAIATRMVTFVDPQEPDLELQAADGLVDVVTDSRASNTVL